MDSLQKIEKYVESNVKNALSNPYTMAILKISLVLYASQIAPTLPSVVSKIFQNTFVKILVIALIGYIADLDFQLAIIIAVIYVLSINGLSGRSPLESYSNTIKTDTAGLFLKDASKLTDLLGNPNPPPFGTLIESSSDNYPGCTNVKMSDLLDVFDGDETKLQDNVKYSYYTILQKLPDDTLPKEKLITIAKSIGLPGNVEFNDYNAPLIATFLLNAGFKITNTCQQPN